MLTLEWEPLRQLVRDDALEALLINHWREVAADQARIPLCPDWDRAFALEEMGVLRCAAMRREGKLIGYNAFHVAPHIHYASTLFAVNDVIFVDRWERGAAGVKLVRGTEAMLKALGVVKIIYHTKAKVLVGRGKKVGDLLAALGYDHFESLYAKLIG